MSSNGNINNGTFRFAVISDLDQSAIEVKGSGEEAEPTGNLVAYLREGNLHVKTDPGNPNSYLVCP